MPVHIDGNGVAGGARLNSREQAFFPQDPVDQGRFSAVGAADHCNADRGLRGGSRYDGFPLWQRVLALGLVGQRLAQRGVEIGKSFPVLGGDGNRVAETELVGLQDSCLGGAALALVCDQDRRALRTCARDRQTNGLPAIGPARASIRNSTTSAAAIATSVCWRMRSLRVSGGASSRPAVSNTWNSRSPRRAWPSRRSRVTPGVSSTSARRFPTRRLNSVDLPTFGRPTMATVKLMP